MKSFRVGKVAMTPKGKWQEGVKYDRLDVVLHQGSSYVSVIDENDAKTTDGDAWKMLAIGSNGVAEIVEAEYSKEINNTNNFFTIDGDTLNFVGYTQKPVALDGEKTITVTFVGTSYQCSILLCDEAGINGSGTTETVLKLASHSGRYSYEFVPNVHDDVKYIKIGVICPGTTVNLSLKESIDVSSERMWQELKTKANDADLYVALASMGFALDNVGGGSVAYVASVGDVYYDADSKHIKYMAGEGDVRDLGEPSDKKVYCNAVSKLLYIWRGGTWVYVGGVDAYTKRESDERYAVKSTEGKVTALQKSVSENYADLGGRLGYAEDAIVQVGNDVKNLRADTVSALDKKCDQEQYDAFKQTATEKFGEIDSTLAGKADLTNSEQVITAGGLDAVGVVRAQQGLFIKSEPTSATQTKFEPLANGMGLTVHSTDENGEDASGYIIFNYPEENTAQAITTANVEQATGNSENFPMSQKAVTDALKAKQNLLTAGVGIAIEGDVVSAREEVLYDDYFYPNKQPTTDTVRFTDSYEVLQPTAYVGDYTDADGVQWQNVWECEGFPDWFDYAEQHCYPYGNGISTGGVVLKTYTLNDAGELTYNLYSNKAAGRESLYNNNVGIKKIDDTHFTLYRQKGPTLNYLTGFNVTYAEPDTWCICNQCFFVAYDLTDCKRFRIEISGQTQMPSKYSSLLTAGGDNVQMLRNYMQVQVVYGTIANVFEFNEDKSKYRVLRSTDSLYYRTSVTGAITHTGGDFVMNSRWIDMPKSANNFRFYYNIINGERRVFFGTNYLYNPALNLYLNCRVKITKLE